MKYLTNNQKSAIINRNSKGRNVYHHKIAAYIWVRDHSIKYGESK